MSRFSIVSTLDEERWNSFVCEHPKGSIFHTSYMMEVFRGTKHYYPLFLAALDASGEVAALLLSVRIQTLPDPLGIVSSRAVFYAEPICRDDACGVESLAALLTEHDRQMRNRTLFAEVRPIKAAGAERRALEQCGYKYEDYLNFLIDLDVPAGDLWSQLSNTCRANIRRGHKRGVHAEDATTEEGLDTLYDFLKLTYDYAKVPLADKSLFATALRVLQPHDMVRIFVAYHEDKPVGACIVLLYKKVVYEWYWGVERTKSIYPAECITWHRIEWGQQNGYAQYDFGGAGWPNKPYGVRDFKAKFGGKLVNYGRYRKIYSPLRFTLASKSYDLARSIAGRVKAGGGQGGQEEGQG